jgi:hypothetical protein
MFSKDIMVLISTKQEYVRAQMYVHTAMKSKALTVFNVFTF